MINKIRSVTADLILIQEEFMKNKRMRNDIILVAVLVLFIALSIIFLMPKNKGNLAVVKLDGKETARYPLSENIETDIISDGINRLVIEDGKAYISYADCKTQVCVKSGKIQNVGETIVCLPHSLIIEIISE